MEAEVCTSCGSGLATLKPCPRCGELLCQDCEETHICIVVCDQSWSAGSTPDAIRSDGAAIYFD